MKYLQIALICVLSAYCLFLRAEVKKEKNASYMAIQAAYNEGLHDGANDTEPSDVSE